ncbi:MAG: hypothetical protein NZ455_12115 [Bacteroidia bacterium]|nr:hypothetical protein [Bacteroidia bacterium]MDW8347190.1 hypothetical protein [Bacteroidia bacterium]
MNFIFWACPSLTLGSGYCALCYRFGAMLRSALPDGMLHSPHASSILMFCLGFFNTYLCFTLSDVDYETLTKLKFFILFQLRRFYLVFY